GSSSIFYYSWDRFVWTGVSKSIEYQCTCRVHPKHSIWFFHVQARNRSESTVRVDAIHLQDLALAAAGQGRNNELFTSQYLDHRALDDPESGLVLITRQNLAQPGRTHPALVQGWLSGATGFSTDGLEIFGAEYKTNGVCDAMRLECIGRSIKQSELAYTAMQSRAIQLAPDGSFQDTWFARFIEDHPAPCSEDDLPLVEQVRQMWRALEAAPGSAAADLKSAPPA